MKNTIENWKKIPNYNYEVSDMGRVRNFTTKKIKAQFINSSGYSQVNLGYRKDSEGNFILRDGRKVQYLGIVSRLVCENFIPIPKELSDLGLTMLDLECNHKSEDKRDNTVENLEWVTRVQNMNYGTRNQRQSYYASSMPQSHRNKLSEAAKRRGAHKNNGKKVGVKLRALDGTEVEFKSARDAARYLNINPSRIHYNAKSGGDINGYTVLKIN